VRIVPIAPSGDEALAEAVMTVQRAAYAVEAALMGDDRIPALHESVADLRAADLVWLAAFDGESVAGAVAWTADPTEVDIDRLVVDPPYHRRGFGRALVQAVLDFSGERRTVVSTGRANTPARALYETLGFVRVEDAEVLPGLWITRYRHPS
jgi:ribosomal protein S18 acetylase RimI-like enzyme